MNGWSLDYEGFQPEQEPLREALCTLGNGYFATRGAAPEAPAGGAHYPGTYIAGVYDRLVTPVAGRDVENEDLVNAPNWLALTFRRPGRDWFLPEVAELLDYHQELDLRRGVLYRRFRVREDDGAVTAVAQRRIVSMADPHVAALETTFVAENWAGTLEIRSSIDGGVTNAGVARYRALRGDHLRVTGRGASDDATVWVEAATTDSRRRIGLAARLRVVSGRESAAREVLESDASAGVLLRLGLAAGEPTVVEKVVWLGTDRDAAVYDPGRAARTWIHRLATFPALLERHVQAWDHLWGRLDTQVDGRAHTQMVVRLHVFHLLQTVSLHTVGLDVGVPARGLHGEAYRGHIFWDQLFILPLLNLRLPVVSRALLEYRYRRLPEARQAALEAGYRGAMFPWQSGSDGREESQQLHLNPRSGRWLPDHSRLQRHIGSAVAFSAWRHYGATGDLEFLRFRGAPLIIEVARFWSSLATYDRVRDRYEIRGVMGPDEYHDGYPESTTPGLNNNAYTNVMAAWVLWRALDVLQLLEGPDRDELWDSLALTRAEVERFEEISRKLVVPFHDGVISQFEGYEALEELDWDRYRRHYGEIHRLDRILEAEGDSPNRYKVSKQADALMLFYLFSASELGDLLRRLGYEFDPDVDIRRNVDYYVQRTSHGSTLSRLVHAWALSRVDRRASWDFFSAALESDVADIQGGTTPEGIHLGAMAGTVDLVQRCYAGIETRDGTLVIDPGLPDELARLSLTIHFRGQRIAVDVTHDAVRLHSHVRRVSPIRILVAGEEYTLHPGESREVSLDMVLPAPAAAAGARHS